MPNVNQSLLDAYNALFSNTPYGAMLRQRVMAGLQQNVSTGGQRTAARGTAGAAEQNPFQPEPSGMGAKDPTAVGIAPTGGVPGAGTPGAGTPGAAPSRSPTDRYGPAAAGLSAGWSPSSPGGWSWSGRDAWGGARTGARYGMPAGGILGGAAGAAIGGLIGGFRRNQPAFPGYRMPSFTGGGFSGRDWGGFNPSTEPGVIGGYAGYQGGGPDERGGGFGFGGGADAGSPSGGEPGDPGLGYM